VTAGAAGGPADAGASSPGTVFTVSSATGGCGKTFYATNVAFYLAKHTGRRVCIVDLDLQFGEVSTALRLRPPYTIYDALSRDDTSEEDLQAHIEEYLVRHQTGVWVLAAPKDPAEADRISPPDVTRIIEAVRTRFDYVIVDTPAQLSEIVLAAFDLSQLLFSMATLDLPSVRNMSVFLSTLDKLKIPSKDIVLILNKAETDVGIDIPQIEKLFTQGFRSVLPYAKEVSRSINLGVPVMASSPDAEISRKLAKGMVDLLPAEFRTKVTARSTAKRRLFGRHKAATTG
jgi:pilus assembly protein CpaE